MFSVYFPLLLLLGAVMLFVVATMGLTHLLGPKRAGTQKHEAFECGIPSQGDARTPFSVQYFVVAILFVLFDVEVIFLYPWAVEFKQLGWTGFLEVCLFSVMVCLGFFYLYRHRLFTFKK